MKTVVEKTPKANKEPLVTGHASSKETEQDLIQRLLGANASLVGCICLAEMDEGGQFAAIEGEVFDVSPAPDRITLFIRTKPHGDMPLLVRPRGEDEYASGAYHLALSVYQPPVTFEHTSTITYS